jgi:hypothetical protein
VGALILSVNRHCRDYQLATGSGYAPLIVVSKDSFRVVKGDITYRTKRADSGNSVLRGFCSECGSRLTLFKPHRPQLALVHAASLDDPAQYTPSSNIYTSCNQPWNAMDHALVAYPQMPPIPDGFGC